MRLKHSGQQLDAAITKVMSDYADVSDVDATPSDVRAGKHYVNSSKQLVEGTLADAEITLGAVVSSAYVEENNSGYPILIVPTATVEKAGYVSNIPNGSYPTKYIRVEEKSVTPSEETQNITPSVGKLLKNVTVNPIPEEYIVPSGQLNITENGVTDVTQYASASVSVPLPKLNTPSISIEGTELTITNPTTNGNFTNGYKIYADGDYVTTYAAAVVDLLDYIDEEGSYSITVKCVGTSFLDSNASESATLVVNPQLTAPSISLDGSTLSITDEDGNATEFDIYVDGVKEATVQKA